MLNQVIVVGRLVKELEIIETENGKKRAYLTLACSRPFKNENGEYETDFIDCVLWQGVAENTAEYCHKGDIIGIKGRVQSYTTENEDGTKNKKMEIVAEKVTFLSSKQKEAE